MHVARLHAVNLARTLSKHESGFRRGTWPARSSRDELEVPNGGVRPVTPPAYLDRTCNLPSPPPHLILPAHSYQARIAGLVSQGTDVSI